MNATFHKSLATCAVVCCLLFTNGFGMDSCYEDSSTAVIKALMHSQSKLLALYNKKLQQIISTQDPQNIPDKIAALQVNCINQFTQNVKETFADTISQDKYIHIFTVRIHNIQPQMSNPSQQQSSTSQN